MHRLEGFPPAKYLFVFIRILLNEGVAAVWKASVRKLTVLLYRLRRPGETAETNTRIAAHAGDPPIISCPLLDWNIPLFQRPQQIAIHLAKAGHLYYYCTVNRSCDSVWGYEELATGLYLTNRFHRLMASSGRHVLHIYSTDLGVEWTLIEKELESGNVVLYEYIDEINPLIPRVPIPEWVFARHENILGEERCVVIATADKLYRNVLRHRSRNCALVTNGVDYEHFSRSFSQEDVPIGLREIVAAGRPIIGYFGALVSWFDYELVLAAAEARPEYAIVLIGWDYDRSMDAYPLHDHANIHVLGPVPYTDLPRYACRFDVSTIPFRINEITESTSPIKLFEYMALGHPIVTTALPECRKYRSVLIGEDHAGYIDQLDQALSLRGDAAYAATLRQEALENTWEAKAGIIGELIRKNWR